MAPKQAVGGVLLLLAACGRAPDASGPPEPTPREAAMIADAETMLAPRPGTDRAAEAVARQPAAPGAEKVVTR